RGVAIRTSNVNRAFPMHSGVGACGSPPPFSGQAPCLGASPTGPQHTSFCAGALGRNSRVYWLFAAAFGCHAGGLRSLLLAHAAWLFSCRTGSRARRPGVVTAVTLPRLWG